MLDFMWARMGESQARTFPRELFGALSWIEGCAGIPEDRRVSKNEIVKRCVEKAAKDAEEAAPDQVKAPRIPVVVIAGLEVAVGNEELPVCLRVVAWCRLLKTFGVLRADDLQRISPDDVELQGSYLTAKMRRTKTSGAGKKVRDLTMFVLSSAWIVVEGWFRQGFELWRTSAPWARDYFLPRPSADLETFQQRMAEPSDIAALNTRVLEELEMSGEIPESAGAKLVGKNLGAVWSGHSERATLPTGLAAMGFRVRIGIRWGDGARKARTPTSAATGPW